MSSPQHNIQAAKAKAKSAVKAAIKKSIKKTIAESVRRSIEGDILQQRLGEPNEPLHGHSKIYLQRDRASAHQQLMRDYFDDNPTFTPNLFRRRFRMRKELFLHITKAVEAHNIYFQQRRDACGAMGFTSLQKCTVAIRQLAYGAAADQYDEYLRVAETTGIQCLQQFCQTLIGVFGAHYLRKPTTNDQQHLMAMHEARHGFPGMLGSLDCMHWEWKNCPVAWKGQFTRGDHGVPTIMLEAVASSDLWIWHAFFGVAGSNNDINVLNRSTLFNDVLGGHAPEVPFTLNGTQNAHGYYLTDGIYPEWATFVKSFKYPQDPKRKKFKEMQEAARKDVERAFGVLQARWAIIKYPARGWYREVIANIMHACIILHNMIVEDEGEMVTEWENDEPSTTSNHTEPEINSGPVGGFTEYLKRVAQVRDREIHHRLRSDLVEHIWERFGE